MIGEFPWRRLAACRLPTVDSDIFFPVRGGAAARQVREAKAICAQCPVRKACRDEAMADETIDGIWGGLTTDERRQMMGRWTRRRLVIGQSVGR